MARLTAMIGGRPRAWCRPRYVRTKGGKWRSLVANKRSAPQLAELVRGLRESLAGSDWDPSLPVKVSIVFEFFEGKEAGQTWIIVDQYDGTENYRTSRPDVDNLAKLVLEALGPAGIVDEDSQVVRLEAVKVGKAKKKAKPKGDKFDPRDVAILGGDPSL